MEAYVKVRMETGELSFLVAFLFFFSGGGRGEDSMRCMNSIRYDLNEIRDSELSKTRMNT